MAFRPHLNSQGTIGLVMVFYNRNRIRCKPSRGGNNVNVDSGRFPKLHLFLEQCYLAWPDALGLPMLALNDDSFP
jgi:hypothetical protein